MGAQYGEREGLESAWEEEKDMTRWLPARNCMVATQWRTIYPTDLHCPVFGRICIPSVAEALWTSLVPELHQGLSTLSCMNTNQLTNLIATCSLLYKFFPVGGEELCDPAVLHNVTDTPNWYMHNSLAAQDE